MRFALSILIAIIKIGRSDSIPNKILNITQNDCFSSQKWHACAFQGNNSRNLEWRAALRYNNNSKINNIYMPLSHEIYLPMINKVGARVDTPRGSEEGPR